MSSLTVIGKGPYANSGRTYVVGQRSWIAPHLFEELEDNGHRPEYMAKAEVGAERLLGATMYLIAGVARPATEEMAREEDLCRRAASTGARLIYLSSSAVDRWEAKSRVLSPAGELYVLGKRRCEQIVGGARGYSLRAPVIFGPGQRLESDMLLPTIVRHHMMGLGPIRLNDPFLPFQMSYVKDVVAAMVQLSEVDPCPVTSVVATPDITPIELVDLASPGWSIDIPPRWKLHPRTVGSVGGRDDAYIHHVTRITIPFKRADVISTVAWYNDQAPELVAPGTLLLEG